MENVKAHRLLCIHLQHVPLVLLMVMILLLITSAYYFNQWYKFSRYNRLYQNQTLLEESAVAEDAVLAIQQAYILSKNKQTPDVVKRIVHFLTIAEAAKNPNIRSTAKLAVGNLYFDLSAISADVAAGGSHQQAVAQIELAREAYKAAIRLNPNMHDAKFNLELLDRLSPEKRTQAWLAETDGVTLQPFKKNGTARMRDNRRRGLP